MSTRARRAAVQGMTLALPENVKYDEKGLVTAVVQDRTSGDVLMVAWMNAEALEQTVKTGQAHFWSRSRQALWRKGETSGNVLLVREVRTDCDNDTLLLLADAEGPACHQGTRTCFGELTLTKAGVLAELSRVIKSRQDERPKGSYTVKLLDKGIDHTLKKVGEEATEFIIAAKGESDERLAEEAADVLYHLTMALTIRGVPFPRVLEVLRRRRAGSTR